MRLKAMPGDFKVREVLDFEPDPHGEYYIHRLRKRKLDTLEALTMLTRETGITREDIAFAGLKDRQAETEQWISIRGKRVDLERHGLEIEFIDRSATPITSKLSEGNEFKIVVRDLGLVDVARVRRNVPSLLKAGFPNFFDDQRFGCLKHGQGFPMKAVLAGDFEKALHMIVARPSHAAITGDVKLKKILHLHWRDWDHCARVARGPMFGRVFQHLVDNPEDYAGALEALPMRVKLIHAYAFQSMLWNRAAALFVRGQVLPRERMLLQTAVGKLSCWRYLKEDQIRTLHAASTPLPGPDGLTGDPAFQFAMRAVLEEQHLQPSALGNVRIPGMILKEEPRALVVVPTRFSVSEMAHDTTSPGRHMLTLTFRLPRGAYATMLIKRLFAEPPRVRPDREQPRTTMPPRSSPNRRFGVGGGPGPRHGSGFGTRTGRGQESWQ